MNSPYFQVLLYQALFWVHWFLSNWVEMSSFYFQLNNYSIVYIQLCTLLCWSVYRSHKSITQCLNVMWSTSSDCSINPWRKVSVKHSIIFFEYAFLKIDQSINQSINQSISFLTFWVFKFITCPSSLVYVTRNNKPKKQNRKHKFNRFFLLSVYFFFLFDFVTFDWVTT